MSEGPPIPRFTKTKPELVEVKNGTGYKVC